jgi:AraC-like DNA-binding protein
VYGVDLFSDRSFGRHWHDSFGFCVMDQGGHRSASGRGPVEALDGQVVTSNPGEVHDGAPLGHLPRRWRMVHLSPRAMASLLGSCGHELTRPVLQDPRVYQALADFMQHWSTACSGSERHLQPLWTDAFEETIALLSGELVRVAGNRPLPQQDRPPMSRVRECLLDRLQDPPSLSELADDSGLSRYQLVRQFSKAHGLPPFAWLQQQRLQQAQRLIASGMALGEAACTSGFSDQSHLNRLFVRCLGFTPGQWQRACRGPLQ